MFSELELTKKRDFEQPAEILVDKVPNARIPAGFLKSWSSKNELDFAYWVWQFREIEIVN